MGVVKKVLSPSPAPPPPPPPAPTKAPPAEPPAAAPEAASGLSGTARRRLRTPVRRGGGGVRILFSEARTQEEQGPKNVLGTGQRM